LPQSCGARPLATRALILQAIEELAKTSKQALKSQDEAENSIRISTMVWFQIQEDEQMILSAHFQGSSESYLATNQNPTLS